MTPGLRSWKFYALLACCMGLFGFGFGDGLAYAVRLLDAVLSNTRLHQVTAQGSGLIVREARFRFPVDADGPQPYFWFEDSETIVKMVCVVHAEVTNGSATGTSNTVLADTSHINTEGQTVDFTQLGLDTDGSDQIWNISDGSACSLSAVNSNNQLTCSSALAGGTNNTFANGNAYSVQRDDVVTRIQLYPSGSNGRWTFTQIADTMDCGLGRTTDNDPDTTNSAVVPAGTAVMIDLNHQETTTPLEVAEYVLFILVSQK